MAKHGTRSRYVQGCKCERCKAANRRYQRGYMRGRRPTVGGKRVFDVNGEQHRQRHHPAVWEARVREAHKSWRTS